MLHLGSPHAQPVPSGRGKLFTLLRGHPMLRGPLAMVLIGAVILRPKLIVFFFGHLHADADLMGLSVVATMAGSIAGSTTSGLILLQRMPKT